MENELELTVKLFEDLKEIVEHLKKKGFKIIKEFQIEDIYMTLEKDIYNKDPYELLGNSLLLRNNDGALVLSHKSKQYGEDGSILYQHKYECKIESIEKAKELLESAGYNELITINQTGIDMSNGRVELVIFDVKDLGIYLEMEKLDYHKGLSDEEIIKDMIENLNKLGLKMGSNYYEKKVFDALEKLKNNKK